MLQSVVDILSLQWDMDLIELYNKVLNLTDNILRSSNSEKHVNEPWCNETW